MRPFVLLLCGALVLTACASTKPGPNPDAGAKQTKARKPTRSEGIDENIERRLLVRAEEERKTLDDSGFLYPDQALEDYLNSVARKVWPPRESGVAVYVKVIRNPELNAFAFPTGKIYVHSGILAAMDSEAQLAALLGHEIIHAANHHAAQEFTKRKIRSESKATLTSLLGSLGEALGSYAIMVSVNGYSREFEAEADEQGLAQAVKAGYDPREAPKLHRLLLDEIDAKKSKASFVYSRHPETKDRIASYEELLRTEYKGRQGIVNTEVYRRQTTKLLLDNAALDIKQGTWASAERTIKKFMVQKGDDPRAFFLLGEMHREQGGPDHEKDAMSCYQRAVTLKPDYAEPYRAMGMMAYKKGDKQQARGNLERYLALRPAADDREYIRQYISESK